MTVVLKSQRASGLCELPFGPELYDDAFIDLAALDTFELASPYLSLRAKRSNRAKFYRAKDFFQHEAAS